MIFLLYSRCACIWKVEIIEFLIFCSIRPFPPLIWNSKESPAHAKTEICKLLLLANADVNAKDEMKYVACVCKSFWSMTIDILPTSDETVLHYSAGIGNIEECKLLLIAKADVNARSDRWTPPGPPRARVSEFSFWTSKI
jgi:hypothetical protein